VSLRDLEREEILEDQQERCRRLASSRAILLFSHGSLGAVALVALKSLGLA